MTQREFAEIQMAKIKEFQDTVQNTFYFLEAEELNMQPANGGWSTLQCIEHINLTNALYIKAFEIYMPRVDKSGKASKSHSRSLAGRIMINNIQLKNGKVRYKMKTFNRLKPLNEIDPKARLVEHVVFEKFNQDCQKLTELINDSVERDWKKIRIKGWFGKYATLNFGDAIAFVNAHTERHIVQAIKVQKGE